MKELLKLITLLIIVLKPISIQAQEYNPKLQSFEVENFRHDISSSLDINFNIITSNNPKVPYKYPYTIRVSLYENDQKIWENLSEKTIVELEAKKDNYFGNYMFFDIPFEEIKLKSGKHMLFLKVAASYKDYHFPVFFEKEFFVDVPILYDYDEQFFILTNYQVYLDKDNYKTPGLLIRSSSEAKFIDQQINGFRENPFIGKYVFNVQLKDKYTGEIISLYNPNNRNDIFTIESSNNFHQIFIPYNELVLPAKKQEVFVEIFATTIDENKVLSEVQVKEIEFIQPILHRFHFKLDKALVEKKKYDPTSSLGQLFSKKESNIGKGNPDVFWELRTGNFVKFTSKTVNNAFSAQPDETTIRVTTQDSLKLFFWDDDVFKDDLIEMIELINPPINTPKNTINKQTDNLEIVKCEYYKN